MKLDGNNSRVLVTGAAGWLGRAICASLQESGVVVIAADLAEAEGPWSMFVEIDLCAQPIASAAASRRIEALGPITAVIHCAGYAHRPVETPVEVARFHAINAEGTRRTLDWARALGIPRFVYLSSVAFYDWAAISGPADEESPLAEKTAYAASKLAGEQAVIESGLDYRVARLATVFGAGDRANFAKLAAALKRRRFLLPGAGEARKSVISVDRAAEWLAALALREAISERILNLGFTEAPSLREICNAYAEVCGFPYPPRIPLRLLRVAGFFGDQVARVAHGFPMTRSTLQKLTRSTEVNCQRAAAVFPEIKQCTFVDELKKAKEWYVEDV